MCVVCCGDGKILSHDVYRALAINRARLSYVEVGSWLEGRADAPVIIDSDPELEDQIWMLEPRRQNDGTFNPLSV